MVKVRVFDFNDGGILASYMTSVIPCIGEGMFLNDLQCKVKDVHHIVRNIGKHDGDYYVLDCIEVEVEVI